MQDKGGKDIHLGEFWDYDNKKWGESASEAGGPVDLCVYPDLVDWDGDGDLDLLLGGFKGTIGLRINEGDAKSPSFAEKTEFVMSDGEPLSAGAAASVEFVDWDGDGLKDLICGTSRGAIVWSKNTGEKGKPTFGKMETLAEKAADGPSAYLRVNATDYNGDGKADLVIGAYDKKRKPGIWVYLQD